MARTLTNNLSLQYAVESALGVPGTVWKTLQPNEITRYGAEITKVARDPISKTRQRLKGTIVDLDSTVEFDHDVTMELMDDILPTFVMSVWKGTAPFVPTAVTATGYTVASGGALPVGTLIFCSGFANAANNGLKVVTTSISTEIRASGLVAETIASPVTQNVKVEIAGVEGTASDITVNAGGNLQSTTLNWSTLSNLMDGQWIYVGDTATVNQFANAANRGFARVRSRTATICTIDRKSQAFVSDTGTGKNIRIFFGRFLRDVAVDHADYLEQSIQFEAAFKNLATGPADAFMYAKGNYYDVLRINVPLTNKATCTVGTVGTDTAPPTTSRASGASTPVRVVKSTVMNTTADIGRLRVMNYDETGAFSDFKSLTFSLANGVNGEKVVGQLGAKYMNTGNFVVGVETQVLLTAPDLLTAVRNNSSMAIDCAVKNENGGFVLDLPAVTLEGGDLEFPRNETIKMNLQTAAFPDPSLGFVVGFSTFPYIPAS